MNRMADTIRASLHPLPWPVRDVRVFRPQRRSAHPRLATNCFWDQDLQRCCLRVIDKTSFMHETNARSLRGCSTIGKALHCLRKSGKAKHSTRHEAEWECVCAQWELTCMMGVGWGPFVHRAPAGTNELSPLRLYIATLPLPSRPS